eukprot:CAMPEP_0194132734 /NCGR_PEP_ID=MMETSP0152-20130528/3140_1 /TAXON_ID=1049557 /ORGANISM="Thalassiothrix antarctica, Strain L6-D1" /LENGTH=708 /DNA_ID=CAMNT_0038827893 /DNA_START=38 /DNA_END=2164 /DNA_ORIENTATION=+
MISNVSDEPTNPEWPENVFIFDESMSAEEIKEKILPTEDARISYEKVTDGTSETSETYTSKNHFHTRHYALLFKPGTYENCKFEIGYYVQMAGLGKSPTEVKFTGGQSGPFVEALNKDMPVVTGGSISYPGSGLNLDTFWRSVENFSAEECQWAVSQAAPLRNAHIEKDLICGDGGAYSSGGFCSNLKVGGVMDFTSNQQWFTRNAEFGTGTENGAWNTTFSGCTGNVPTPGLVEDGDHVITVEDVPELRVEKPFITVRTENGEDFYELVVPSPANTAEDLVGPKIDGKFNDIRSFSHVKVCKPFLPTSDTPPPEWDTFNDPLKTEEIRKVLYLTEENLAKIGEEYYVDHDDGTYNGLESRDDDLTKDLQKALDEKKDLVLCPGLFFLTKPLIVSHPNQVILGLGLATLIAPQDGSPCIRVEPNVPGVRIAGVTLEGSLQKPPNETEYNEGPKNEDGERSLIDVGKPGVEDAGDKTNPVVLSDLFTRVGGSNCERKGVETDVMVRVHSGNVKGDNLWLWRADHVRLRPAGYGDNESKEEANDKILPYYYQVGIGECDVKNAIKVNGNDVKMYGLFCEHTTEHQMVWNGDRGTVNFFQCEIAYDVDKSYGEKGYAGYYVNPDVENHTGRGIGVYSNFKNEHVKVPHGVIIPKKPNVRISTPFSRFLNNKGGITKVINVVGDSDQAYGEMVHKENKHSRGWIGFGPHEYS